MNEKERARNKEKEKVNNDKLEGREGGGKMKSRNGWSYKT